ncbi:glycosyl hydrolase family 71-domain-containing protein [Macrophomina phaseolina]|uniref:Glycosyl hydrolase family 71-domain-containing protein n=1 Tax=Macrophomina phaseolina TaxID=35725 RepID=A0ABQ8G7B6_9PEZI|nr:glycosyl hydrolase family 71-domain-containing protein [Macrophomina phaseolina]
MRAHTLQCLAAAAAALLYGSQVVAEDPKAVFAHYMAFQVGTINEDHVHQDVDDAAAMGLDGFALNMGSPLEPFSRAVFDYMFDYTRDNHPDFKLFISMDLWSAKNLSDFDQFFTDFLAHDAYYKGPNGFPFVSTYGNGGFSKETWQDWKNRWADKLYFVPDFAGMAGTDDSSPECWESVWPVQNQTNTLSIAADDKHMAAASQNNKTYMIGLSMLQYKNSYGANLYRAGEENLSNRIHNILNMTTKPAFAQLLTWNDGPESHYIGTIWPEQNNDTIPSVYASQSAASHTGIQSVLTSFIDAYKKDLASSDMQPQEDKQAVGALWYKPILSNTVCANETSGELHDAKPDGYEVAADVSAWAVVVAADAEADDLTLRGYSGGEKLGEVALVPGLNFGNFSTLKEGKQCMEVRNGQGRLVLVASGGRDVTSDCPDGIFNLNPQILELGEDVSQGGCTGGDDDGDASGSGDGDGEESWGVRGTMLDKWRLVAALIVSSAVVWLW